MAATATAPGKLDDKELILSEIEKLDLPEGVRFERLQASLDWTGDPLWQIFFAVTTSIPLTERRIEEVGQMKDVLQERLLAREIAGWPMVRFLDAS